MNSLAKEFILIRRNSGFIENLLVVCGKVCIVVKEEKYLCVREVEFSSFFSSFAIIAIIFYNYNIFFRIIEHQMFRDLK